MPKPKSRVRPPKAAGSAAPAPDVTRFEAEPVRAVDDPVAAALFEQPFRPYTVQELVSVTTLTDSMVRSRRRDLVAVNRAKMITKGRAKSYLAIEFAKTEAGPLFSAPASSVARLADKYKL